MTPIAHQGEELLFLVPVVVFAIVYRLARGHVEPPSEEGDERREAGAEAERPRDTLSGP